MSRTHPDVDSSAGRASSLSRWDPRARLVALGTLTAVLACLFSLPGALVGLVLSVGILCQSGLSPRFVARRVLAFTAATLPFVLLLPILGKGHEILRLGQIAFRSGGAELALLIYIKGLAVVLVAMACFNSAALSEICWAARSLMIPRRAVQLGLITIRYLPILAQEAKETIDAAALRSFRMAPTSHAYQTAANIAASVLVRGTLRANRVWHAMQCRGFRGELFPLRSWRMTAADVAGAAVVCALSFGLLAWDMTLWTGMWRLR